MLILFIIIDSRKEQNKERANTFPRSVPGCLLIVVSPPKGFPGLPFFYHGPMSLVKRLASGTRFNQDLIIRFFFPGIRNIFHVIT